MFCFYHLHPKFYISHFYLFLINALFRRRLLTFTEISKSGMEMGEEEGGSEDDDDLTIDDEYVNVGNEIDEATDEIAAEIASETSPSPAPKGKRIRLSYSGIDSKLRSDFLNHLTNFEGMALSTAKEYSSQIWKVVTIVMDSWGCTTPLRDEKDVRRFLDDFQDEVLVEINKLLQKTSWKRFTEYAIPRGMLEGDSGLGLKVCQLTHLVLDGRNGEGAEEHKQKKAREEKIKEEVLASDKPGNEDEERASGNETEEELLSEEGSPHSSKKESLRAVL